MKRLLVAALCLSIACLSFAPKNEVPSLTDYKYQQDALRLTLRHFAKTEDISSLDFQPQAMLRTQVYKALKEVYQSDLSEAKLFTKTIPTHTAKDLNVSSLRVIYRYSADWALPLRMGKVQPEHREMNTFLEQNGLSISQHKNYDNRHNEFYLTAAEPINMAAVAKRFEDFADVIAVEMETDKTSEGDIVLVEEKEAQIQLKYIFRFYDESETLQTYFRTFEVTKAGKVRVVDAAEIEFPKS